MPISIPGTHHTTRIRVRFRWREFVLDRKVCAFAVGGFLLLLLCNTSDRDLDATLQDEPETGEP